MVLVKLFISGDSTPIFHSLSLNPELEHFSYPPNARQIHRGARRPTFAQHEYTEALTTPAITTSLSNVAGSTMTALSALGTTIVVGLGFIARCCL